MRFILDTGIGVNLLSESAAARTGWSATGTTYTGRRMSGQEVRLPIGSVASVRLGDASGEDVPFGVLDIGAAAGLDGIDGFLSLNFFRSAPVTVDYPASVVVVEDECSLALRAESGFPADVLVEHDGPATQVRLPLRLPGGKPVSVEVDTGSDALILDEALAAEAGIDLADAAVRKQEGNDETGHTFARYFTTLRGEISVAGAPAIRQAGPEVMFQRIVYDGLVGNSFLKNFTVTYDLANLMMIFARSPGSDG